MRFFTSLLAPVLALTGSALAAPTASHDKRSIVEREGVVYNVFEHAETGARIEFVNNSGICETTKGVNQYSGYLSVGTNMNMWFWYIACPPPKRYKMLTITRFFEARQNPSTAPLAAWFNGRP